MILALRTKDDTKLSSSITNGNSNYEANDKSNHVVIFILRNSCQIDTLNTNLITMYFKTELNITNWLSMKRECPLENCNYQSKIFLRK